MVSIQRTSYTPLLDPPPPRLPTPPPTNRQTLSEPQNEALNAMKQLVQEDEMHVEQIENQIVKKDVKGWVGEPAMVSKTQTKTTEKQATSYR
jgi:hypothetical protein